MSDYVFWTLCESDGPQSQFINPAPNGTCHIRRKTWTQEAGDKIMRQFGRNDPNIEWGIQAHIFIESDGYSDPMTDAPLIQERGLSSDSIVVSDEGNLIGFLVCEHKVFWIDDFKEGGRFDPIDLGYEPDLVIEKYCLEEDEHGEWSVCAEWDEAVPDNGKPKEYTVVYGILTQQPYSWRFSS